MKRRKFTKIAGLGALALQVLPTETSSLVQQSENADQKRVPLGVCNHSLRGMRLNARQLIEYAIDQQLDSVLFNTFQPFEHLDREYLSDISKRAKSKEVSVYIGAGSISEKSPRFSDKYGNPEQLLTEGIRIASAVGSPVVGCRIGNQSDRYIEGGIEVHMEAVIKVMSSLRNLALDANVKFAFENHAGDLRTDELLTIINETGSDICGALFDPANAVWALEDPMEAFLNLGEHIVCTSVRDIIAWETDDGAVFQGMAIGQGMLDFPYFAKTMTELCPGVPLHVETISNSARPVPFLTPDFWKGFSDLTAKSITGFLKLIKSGSPQTILQAPGDSDKRSFDIELQKSELLKSFAYLRKHCNAGLKK